MPSQLVACAHVGAGEHASLREDDLKPPEVQSDGNRFEGFDLSPASGGLRDTPSDSTGF